MARTISYTNVLTEDASFQLVRTNPKLTGNIKLTIDESGGLYLDSIKANQELSKDDYSKFPIDTTQSLPANVYQFFKNGTTPNEIIFSLTENVDVTKTSKNYKDQYDFSNYFSGVKYFPSNKYTERLAYFAPLYLKKTLPNYFVIFKINDPINYKVDVSKANYEAGEARDQYLIDMFKNATIIKTFDLSENSAPGKYLRSYLNNPGYPVSPLTVSFNEADYTTWNGILVNAGVFGSRGELFYKQYTESTPLKFFEENITNGFSRNGVIAPNILNIEFVFNDDTSVPYEFNRYVGLYVDTVELSQLDIDLDRIYAERGSWPNEPRFRKKYYEYESVVLKQTNPTGVVLPHKNLDINLSEFSNIFTDSQTLYFNYLSDKDGNLHLPKLSSPYSIDLLNSVSVDLTSSGTLVTATTAGHLFNTDDFVTVTSVDPEYSGSFFVTRISDTVFTYLVTAIPGSPTATGSAAQEEGYGKITLSDKSIDLGKFFGPSDSIFLQDIGNASLIAGRSHIAIKFKNLLNDLDEFRLYHPHGTRVDSNGKYDLFTATVGYSLVPNAGDYYFFNDYSGTVGHDTFYFNASGLITEVVSAFVGCLNKVRNRSFTAFAYDDYVFIKVQVNGDHDSKYSINYESQVGDYSRVEIGGVTGTQLSGAYTNFVGGSSFSGNRLIIDSSHLSKILADQSNLLVKTASGWSKILKVTQYIDDVTPENQILSSTRATAITSYLNKIALVLELNDTPTISYREFAIRKKFRPGFGFISLFPIKDLDFDFYYSDYARFPEIDLYQNYFVPANTLMLEPSKTYSVVNGTIEVNGSQYASGSTFTVMDLSKYTIVLGNPLVSLYSATSPSLLYPINDQNKELTDFTGFSILKDPSTVVPQTNTEEYELRTKYINGLSTTEYDYYKENATKDFATRSKIIPYITKWRFKDGTDSRSNPYRLNTELVFGRNNFSPDHTDRTQNPANFTHEWFYIESKFNYANDLETIKQNFYYFDSPLDPAFILRDPNYFIDYFTYVPSAEINGTLTEVGHSQFRYSTIFKNVAGQYETFFKGFKAIFKDVTDPTVKGADGKPVANPNTTRFNDYKFSCILKPVKEDFTNQNNGPVPPIKYRVIEHKDFKFILVVIEISVGYLDQIDPYWSATGETYTSIGTSASSAPVIFFGDTSIGSVPAYSTVNGDYRIAFDSDNVSNISHGLLYSLKHKKFNNALNNYSNVRLSSKLSLVASGVHIGIDGGTIDQIVNPQFANYPSILSDEILLPSASKMILATNYSFPTPQVTFIDTINGFYSTNSNPITSVGETSVQYTLTPTGFIGLSTFTATPPYTNYIQPLPLIPNSFEQVIRDKFVFSVFGGGERYFEKLLEKISFSKFKEYVNSLNPIIEFESYSLDPSGNPVKSATPNYYFEIADQSIVAKKNQTIVNIDNDKPTQFSFSQTIGYTYETVNLNNTVDLNRYKGEYEPIAKDVLFCNSTFVFSHNKISDIKLANIQLNTQISDLLTIQNFSHIKVSDLKILLLESDNSYLPKYPAVSEVAIGQAPYFLLGSNWDWGFHHKYVNSANYVPAAGSSRVEEDESFIGKIVAVPSEIALTSFVEYLVPAGQKLESIDLTDKELVVIENQTTVDGYINLANVLTSYFINNGISQKFNEFLVNQNQFIGNYNSIEAYVRDYIALNLLKLYDLDTADFYTKRDATVTTTNGASNPNSIQFVFLNDDQRFKQGYTLSKSAIINKKDRLILKFSIQKNLNAGLLVSPSIKIKFI